MNNQCSRILCGRVRPRVASGAVTALLATAVFPLAIAHGQRTAVPQAANQRHPPAQKRVQRAEWIWAPGPVATPETVYFRQGFRISEPVQDAELRVAARGPFAVYVDGYLIVRGAPSEQPETLVLTRYVSPGENLVAFECQHSAGAPGLWFDLGIRYKSGRIAHVVSNGDERVATQLAPGWERTETDDRGWPVSVVLGLRAAAVRAAKPTGAGTPRSGAPPNGRAASVPPAPVRRPNGPGGAGRRERPSRAAAREPVEFDAGRLTRVWDIEAGRPRGEDAYARPRIMGERMVLSSTMPASAADLPVLASAGFTMLESATDALSTDQTAPGQWDFSAADRDLRLATEQGFAWSFFPHFAFPPAWFRDQAEFTRVQCLEHHLPIQAFSPWDPKFGQSVSEGCQAVSAHWPAFANVAAGATPRGEESLYLGVYGEYGATGMLSGSGVQTPALAEAWKRRFGNLHDHLGWWCDDALARADFRQQVLRKYRDVGGVNAAWHTQFGSAEEIDFPSNPNDVARRYWLDFAHWYLNSATGMAETVAQTARRSFPTSLLMLPLGFADEDPRGGNDNSLAAKIASEQHVDVRSTHGGFRPFAENQATMWGRIASAARFYGAPLWSEPPRATNSDQLVGRIFEAASQGVKGFVDRPESIRANRETYYRYGRFLRVERPIVDVAMLFPTTSHLLRGDSGYPATFEKGCAEIRDALNYDIVDERMVRDGALDRYRVLVMWEGSTVEGETLAKIRDWVQAGGVVCAYDFGKIETVEGDRSWFSDLFGYAGRLRSAQPEYKFVSTAPVPTRYRVNVTRPEAAPFLAGDWMDETVTAGEPHRWAGREAEVKLPLDVSQHYTLIVRAAGSPDDAAGRRRHDVLVNGVRVGSFEAADDTTYRFPLPTSMTERALVAVVTLSTPGRDPGPGALVPHIAVDYVQLEADVAANAQPGDIGTPAGRFETSVDLGRLRNEWARPYGRGWTVYFPARRTQLDGYEEVVRYLTYHLSQLDSTKHDAIAVDDAMDGLYTTLFADKVLYYNPTTKPVTRTVALDQAGFAARRDVLTPASLSYTVTVEPNSIAAVYFDTPPQEMLFQCEGFRQLNGLAPLTGPSFSPGRGFTHVLIPADHEISTRIQIDVSARYNVFYRAVRRGAQARAEVLLDGQPVQPATIGEYVGPAQAATLSAGAIELQRGVHTLTLRPVKGEDVRADFVVLTTDPVIAGYGFGVRTAK